MKVAHSCDRGIHGVDKIGRRRMRGQVMCGGPKHQRCPNVESTSIVGLFPVSITITKYKLPNSNITLINMTSNPLIQINLDI